MTHLLLFVIISFVGLSLFALLKRATVQGRVTATTLLLCGLQVAIWLCVWWLWQPPLVPTIAEAQATSLEQAMSRRALIDLAPRRINTRASQAGPSWLAHWHQRITLGDTLRLTLTELNDIPAETHLTLLDPDGNIVQSHRLDGDTFSHAYSSDTAITLEHVPRRSGLQSYELQVEAGSSRRREPVPVLVENPRTPEILLWTAGPSFETAALQRWLLQSGTPVSVVTQLAPELTRTQQLNGARALGPNPLAGKPYDLVVVDSRLWPTFSMHERRKIEAQPAVLWLVDRDTPSSFVQYLESQEIMLSKLPVPPGVELDNPGKLSPLTLNGFQPRDSDSGDRTIRSNSGEFLYWARDFSEQTIGLVLFDRSYRWITSGGNHAYAALWKQILDQQLQQQGGTPPLHIETVIPRSGHSLQLCSTALAGRDNVQLLETAKLQVPLALLPVSGRACLTGWPLADGWHRLAGVDSSTEFYVFGDSDWPWWQRALSEEDTAQMSMARLGPFEKIRDRTATPRYWIVLALLLLLTVSWILERRGPWTKGSSGIR